MISDVRPTWTSIGSGVENSASRFRAGAPGASAYSRRHGDRMFECRSQSRRAGFKHGVEVAESSLERGSRGRRPMLTGAAPLQMLAKGLVERVVGDFVRRTDGRRTPRRPASSGTTPLQTAGPQPGRGRPTAYRECATGPRPRSTAAVVNNADSQPLGRLGNVPVEAEESTSTTMSGRSACGTPSPASKGFRNFQSSGTTAKNPITARSVRVNSFRSRPRTSAGRGSSEIRRLGSRAATR